MNLVLEFSVLGSFSLLIQCLYPLFVQISISVSVVYFEEVFSRSSDLLAYSSLCSLMIPHISVVSLISLLFHF